MSRRTITAVWKRTHPVVNTKKLYVRPANDDKQPVIRILLSDKADFLVEESRLKYDFYRKGGSAVPNEVQWELLWSQATLWRCECEGGNRGATQENTQSRRYCRLFPRRTCWKKQSLSLLQTWHCDDEQTLEEALEEQMEEMGTEMDAEEASAGDD